MRVFLSLVLLLTSFIARSEYKIPGFKTSRYFNEQEFVFRFNPDVMIEINAPAVKDFNPKQPVAILLYALPNVNTTDWTKGKQIQEGENWRFGIQHIAAQTRFIRAQKPGFNLVTVYLESKQKAWPVWRKKTPDSGRLLLKMIDEIRSIFSGMEVYVILSGHSGGGSMIFGFIENVNEIPDYVQRIMFLDSNYNWKEEDHADKLIKWLNKSRKNVLSVISYDDKNALYNGKPIVSDTGGTGYRSKMMLELLRGKTSFKWNVKDDTVMTATTSKNKQVQFLSLKNLERKIFHTVLVEKNGLVHGTLFATKRENRKYEFWGEPAYKDFIQGVTVYPHGLKIPLRQKDALGVSEFNEKIKNVSVEERENIIYDEIAVNGNIPISHRIPIVINETLNDANGISHDVEIEVMPDVLSVGIDNDNIKIPMLPKTAQHIADCIGGSIPTRKILDLIHKHNVVKSHIKPMTLEETVETVSVEDYSNVVCLVNREILVDGKIMDINQLLQDSVLHKLLSY